jgi:hypothetical protein
LRRLTNWTHAVTRRRQWERLAADANLPLWFRLMALAYWRHEANGHANFKRGDLSWILGKPPHDDVPFKPVDKYMLDDTLDRLVGYGWLDKGSCVECLIVPAHGTEFEKQS